MRRLITVIAVLALVSRGASAAVSSPQHSRVIVSATLNSTLAFFDAATLRQTQPSLVSRGLGPVRMVVTQDGCGLSGCSEPRLFVANHGGTSGSVGMFDLAGDVVAESPLSPFPARQGSVGVDAADVELEGGVHRKAVVVTNTTFALGGCGMPNGNVTAFERINVPTGIAAAPWLETMREAGTAQLDSPIPYSVAIAGPHHRAFASTNCGNTLSAIDFKASDSPLSSFSVSDGTSPRAAGKGPDGVIYDARTDRVYVASIDSSMLSSFKPDAGPAIASVSLAGGRPIRVALADSTAGHHWVLTSNGGDDSISMIDRDVLAGCVGNCAQAEVLRVPTGVKGGAPESVAYDATSNRIFVVNKTIGAPSLSVIQVSDSGNLSATVIGKIPLTMLGDTAPGPSDVIAFDVVVQQR